MSRLYENKYGYFDSETNEYVITRPDTPRPWVNIIANPTYGMTISQAGGGYSWRDHAQFNRLTRWDQDLTRDNWGRFLYIRDAANGQFWSPAPKPTNKPLQGYECRHGMGYTEIKGRRADIESAITYFVDSEEPVEAWILDLKNAGKTTRRLSVFTYLEWCLGVAPDAAREFEKLFIETKFDRKAGAVFATKLRWGLPDPSGRPWARPYEFTAFHAAVPKPVAFESDQAAFLGQLGETPAPAAVRKGGLANHQGRWTDGITALQCEVKLRPGQTQSLVFLLGATRRRAEAGRIIARYQKKGHAQAELERVKAMWRGMTGSLQVQTPDPALDLLANQWLPYQAISCRMWGRSAYYQTGGAYGYRDQLQDSLATLPLKPALCREHLARAAKHQFSDGSTFHWWHPITEDGARKRNSDDLLWLPFVALHYFRETGDLAYLEESLPFCDKGKATFREHCQKAIDQVLGRPTPRGIPTMVEGDWNDGLSCIGYDGTSESIWLGEFLYGILVDWAELLTVVDGREAAQRRRRYLAAARKIKNAINKHAWDGDWYIRATHAKGKLGSKKNKVARIFLNAQTWALINDMVPRSRKPKVLKALGKYLYREYGPLLFTPAFNKADPGIGHLSQYAPGLRENGGLYSHAGCWAVIAEALAGDPDRAYQVFSSFNPVLRGWKNPDLYKAEPYVTPGNVDGPESPYFGRGGWTWYSGSAAWLYRAITEYILGVRATHAGLRIEPAIPTRWKSFSMTRRYRGATYEVRVVNKAGSRPRKVAVSVNGQPIRGTVVPPARKGARVRVDVVIAPAQ
ncbi:MAG: glycosyl transferase family 36 [Kiritimatiellae bacterium]|nr:glycosyl transferase family 36 [Kiritimatiellia bacterium]